MEDEDSNAESQTIDPKDLCLQVPKVYISQDKGYF